MLGRAREDSTAPARLLPATLAAKTSKFVFGELFEFGHTAADRFDRELIVATARSDISTRELECA